MSTRRGIRKSSRQSNPGSLLLAQRDVTVTLAHDDQPETVHCVDLRTGQRLLVSEGAVYGATFNSWLPLHGRPQSVVMRELLAAGVVLANLKGIFWTKRRAANPNRFGSQVRRAA